MQVAWPQHELTSGENAGKKKVAITWNDRYQQTFDDLKCLCDTVPNLAYADFTKPVNSTLMHTGLAWGLSSTRLIMMELMLSSLMPVEVWQGLRPTTPPINWSFSLLSGKWLKNPIGIFMDQPLTCIPITTPWCTSCQQWCWMPQAIAGYPALLITFFNCTIGKEGPILKWTPCQGCHSPDTCLKPQAHTTRSLQQQWKPYRRLSSRAH